MSYCIRVKEVANSYFLIASNTEWNSGSGSSAVMSIKIGSP